MSKPYTYEQAKADIGSSTDCEDARLASIRKWQQIAGGDSKSYGAREDCGYCIVKDNRHLYCDCDSCPADIICRGCTYRPPAETLQMLRDLRHKEGEA